MVFSESEVIIADLYSLLFQHMSAVEEIISPNGVVVDRNALVKSVDALRETMISIKRRAWSTVQNEVRRLQERLLSLETDMGYFG